MQKYGNLILLTLLLLAGADAAGRGEVYHRCGTTANYTDKLGRSWLGDRSYSVGSWGYTTAGAGTATTADPIANTNDDALYQSERYGTTIGYRYDGLSNGAYAVTLKFSELYWQKVGGRIFDVAVNNILVLDDLDIYASVGHDAALDFTFRTKVNNGSLIISVPQVLVDNAKLAAIAIVAAGVDAVPPGPPSRVSGLFNAGQIKINWPRNRESDIQGYYLYRAETASGNFVRQSSTLIKAPLAVLSVTDAAVQLGQTYFYYVTAVDANDNESAPSSTVIVATSAQNDLYWTVPLCAWSRSLGDHPIGATGRAKRGVPLGGIGAGNFMFNLCGTFGPWEFKTGTHEEKFLSQAAFHLYEKTKDQEAVLQTLATEDVLSAWERLGIGDGEYFALYPKAWFSYRTEPVAVSLKQFTPIIPHNYRESSYPVGIFQFKLVNPSTDSVQIGLMFTFPNAGYASETRKGFQNQIRQEDNVTGIVLKAVSSQNTSTTQNSEWCIATQSVAGATISYTTSWNGASDGSDISDEFIDDGRLNDGSLEDSNTAAAVAITITLAPGAEVMVPFVLSWDFPRVKFGEGTEWYRRYTEYFGTSADHAFDIAREALLHAAEWEALVDRWQGLIIDEPLYPVWLKQAALNELYYDTFGGVFWENGCITKPAESSYGTLPATDHKYFSMECQEYAMCETFDVRHYECRHYLELWPEIEHDVLLWFADYIANDSQGRAPHDAGAPNHDPFFRFSGYGSDWQDMPSKFIQQVYAYYYKTQDQAFLDFVWPACKKTYYFMKTRDSNNNGLPDHGNTTYDTWGLTGDNLLCGGLWVGALKAMARLAAEKQDAALLTDVNRTLSLAQMVLNVLFWQSDLQYYKLDVASTAIMADGLNGQRFCETTDLDSILPAERISAHLHQVFARCVAPLADYTGDGIGDLGAMNGCNADGSAIHSQQPDEVWTGSSYFIAAMMVHWGMLTNDPELVDHGMKTAYGVYYQTWVNEETAYFFNTPEAWRYDNPRNYRAQQYQRPRAVWELLLEIKNPFGVLSEVGELPERELPAGSAPATLTLQQNYPNPFNLSTTIHYELRHAGIARLELFDLNGRLVKRLIAEQQSEGRHTVIWDGTDELGKPLASGVVFCRLELTMPFGKKLVQNNKLCLLK